MRLTRQIKTSKDGQIHIELYHEARSDSRQSFPLEPHQWWCCGPVELEAMKGGSQVQMNVMPEARDIVGRAFHVFSLGPASDTKSQHEAQGHHHLKWVQPRI